MKAKSMFTGLLLLATHLFFYSCTDNATPLPPDPGKYSTGIFVVNEGPFGGSGSISWYDPASGEVVSDVFARENNGALLGQFVQSLTFHNDKAYIVVNGANKIYVVDAETFKFENTIEGLSLPRFFLPLDDQTALVSQWGADGLTGSVAKIDLNTNTIIQTIPTGAGPDKMLRLPDGLVYVANSGGFGVDSTISVLNPADGIEISRILVGGKNPGSLALYILPGGQVLPYAHCRASFLDSSPKGWVGPLDGTPGFETAPYGDDLVAGPNRQSLFFSAGGSIWKVVYPAAPEKWIDQAAYGLACDPDNGNLYCADARDFSSAGEVVIFNAAGDRISAFTAGVAPGEIVIKR
ncbi:MAG: hypothetical protein IT259_12480 [Saprospiraceae bacterium]|nr:hypothetical protein [Saprospiraceae bacterium]